MAWSPTTTLLSRTRRHRHDTGPPDAIDAKETLLDVHLRLPGVGGDWAVGGRSHKVVKTSYRMLRGGLATPSPARSRRRSAGTPFAKATNRAARQDMP